MRKIIVAVSTFIVLSVANIYFSTILHKMFSRAFDGVGTLVFAECVQSIGENKNHFTIFVSVEIFILLGLALLMLNRFGDYRSKMQKVTPDLKTPVSAGQLQHGSSRWLKKDEYHKAFKTVIFDKECTLIKSLIQGGNKDYEAIREYISRKEKEEDKNGEGN